MALFLLVLAAHPARAQIVHIPDANFKGCLVNNHWPKIDTNGDGEIQVSEAQAAYSINCSGKGITDLTGIEEFINITHLQCGDNELANLDVSQNTALQQLSCQNNKLTGLNLINNTNLQHLYCHDNQLASLDLTNSPNLRHLECQKNKLTSLNVSNNTKLVNFYCYSNELASLDLSNSTDLMFLLCENNKLTSLDLSNSPNLWHLWCGNNELTSLELGSSTNLYNLSCQKNKLTSLDVSKNTGLLYFYCFENELTTLDVTNNTALINFTCADNQLATLDVTNNTALRQLACQRNQLTDLDVTQNTALQLLYCGSNPLANGLDVTQNTDLRRFACNSTGLDELDVTQNVHLWEFVCGDNQLEELDVTKNTELLLFRCENNQLDELDLSKNTKLQQLFCQENELTALDLAKNKDLLILSCYANELAALDLTENTALQQLSCYGNKLTSLDLSNNTALKVLSCRDNQLTDLDLSHNVALERLYVQNNKPLKFLNLRNGNNTAIIDTALNMKGNPMLRCIQVDNAVYSNGNWPDKKDPGACFSEVECVEPVFDPIPAFCADVAVPPVLPDESKNGIKGTWDPPVFDLSKAGTKTHVFTPTACAAQKTTMNITVRKPTVTLVSDAANDMACAGDEVKLTASGAVAYSWDGGSTFASDNAKSVFPTATAKYHVIGKDANGCTSDEREITITVNQVSAGIIESDQTICVGIKPLPLFPTAEGSSDGGRSHRWDYSTDGGATWNPAPGANTGPSYQPDVPPVTTMFRRVAFSTIGASECEAPSNPVAVTVNPKPTVTLDADKPTICAGETVKLTASGATSYTWTGAGTSGNGNEQTVSPTATETYKAIGTDANGCASLEKEIEIAVNPKPTVTLDADKPTICAGETVKLMASGATSYAWTGSGTSGNGADQTVSPTATETYKAIGTDANGCASLEKEIEIAVNPLITPDFDPVAAICPGETLMPLPTVSKNKISGSWSPATMDNMQTTEYTFTPDAGICATAFRMTVTVNDADKAPCKKNPYSVIEAVDDLYEAIWPDDRSTLGSVLDNDLLNGNPVNPAEVVLEPLRPSHPSLRMDEKDGTITIDRSVAPGRYEYPYRICEASDPNNCSHAVATIVVLPNGERNVVISNVFTPNGDGVNDTFEVLGDGSIDWVDVLIINRWGTEVYHSQNYRNEWAGRGLRNGTYYYIVTLHKNGGTETVKGTVLLMK